MGAGLDWDVGGVDFIFRRAPTLLTLQLPRTLIPASLQFRTLAPLSVPQTAPRAGRFLRIESYLFLEGGGVAGDCVLEAVLLVLEVLHEVGLVVDAFFERFDLFEDPEVVALLFGQIQLVINLALLPTLLTSLRHLLQFLVEEVAFPERRHIFALKRGHQITQLVLFSTSINLFHLHIRGLSRLCRPAPRLPSRRLFAERVFIVAAEGHKILQAFELGPARPDKVTNDFPEVADLISVHKVQLVVEAEVGKRLQEVGRGALRLHHELAHQLVVVCQVQEVEQLAVEHPAGQQLAQHAVIFFEWSGYCSTTFIIKFSTFFLKQLFFPHLHILLLRSL